MSQTKNNVVKKKTINEIFLFFKIISDLSALLPYI